MAAQAPEVLLHDGLTLGVVVEGEGSSFGWRWLRYDLAAARAAHGTHSGGITVERICDVFGRSGVDVDGLDNNLEVCEGTSRTCHRECPRSSPA